MKNGFLKLTVVLSLIFITTSLRSQNFDLLFGFAGEDETHAVKSLEGIGFYMENKREKPGYALNILKNEQTVIHLSYELATGNIESIELYTKDRSKMKALLEEIRIKKRFVEEYDLVGEYSSVIFKDSANYVVSIINDMAAGNYTLAITLGSSLYEGKKKYMEDKFPFDQERIKVLNSIIEFVHIQNSKNKTIEEAIQNKIGIPITFVDDIDSFLDDFTDLDEYDQIEEIVETDFLQDSAYRIKAEKVLSEVLEIIDQDDFDAEIMEQALFQVLYDRDLKISLGVLDLLFDELEN